MICTSLRMFARCKVTTSAGVVNGDAFSEGIMRELLVARVSKTPKS
jgi:hypothetical protein